MNEYVKNFIHFKIIILFLINNNKRFSIKKIDKDFRLAEQERESYERKKNMYELHLKKLNVSYNSQQKKLESFVMLYKYAYIKNIMQLF